MYTGRWVSDHDRGNELHPQTIELTSIQPIVTNRFLDRATTDTQIVLFVRIPLGNPYTEYDNGVKDELLGVIYSSSYRHSVYTVGNGKQLRIDIYGRNAAVWSIGTINAETDDYQYHAYCNLIPVNFLMKSVVMAKLNELGYIYYRFFWYDSKGNYISESVSYSDKLAEALYYRSRYYKNNAVHSSTVWDQDDIAVMNRLGGIQYFTRDTASEYVDKNTATYPKGYYSSVCLDTVIPSGAYLDRRNGRYAYTSDQMEWTELPKSDQTKLNALRIGDGENNIYVLNVQYVKLHAAGDGLLMTNIKEESALNDWKPNENVARWRKLAEYWGRQTECPAALILAVVEQESGGDKDAVRYEPEHEKKYKARCEEISGEADIAVPCVASSYGLMQLMLPLAWGI